MAFPDCSVKFDDSNEKKNKNNRQINANQNSKQKNTKREENRTKVKKKLSYCDFMHKMFLKCVKSILKSEKNGFLQTCS